MVHKILVHGLDVNDVQVIACAKALRFRRRLFFTTLSDICGAALRLHPCSSANADCNSDTATKFARGLTCAVMLQREVNNVECGLQQ